MTQRICTIGGCDKKHLARGMCSTHYNRTRYTEDQRHPKRESPCCVCGKTVLRRVDNARLGRHCCSTECRHARQFGATALGSTYDWNSDAKQRARSHGCAVVEDVDRISVMQRDGWACYICGVDTSLISDPFDPASATVDHVIALSNGGEHSMRNVRRCCLGCNSSKAARDALAA